MVKCEDLLLLQAPADEQSEKTLMLCMQQMHTCVGEVCKDVGFAGLAIGRRRHDAPDPEVAPPGVPYPVVKERLPPLHHIIAQTSISILQDCVIIAT